MIDESTSDTGRVGCWLLRYDDGETRVFGSIYPTLAEEWDRAEVTVATWRVAK